MKRVIKVFKTSQEQQKGALGQPVPLPKSYVLFFPNVPEGGVMHTRGMTEVLAVLFLTRDFQLLGGLQMKPNEIEQVPPGTRHVIEMSVKADPLKNLEVFKSYV